MKHRNGNVKLKNTFACNAVNKLVFTGAVQSTEIQLILRHLDKIKAMN